MQFATSLNRCVKRDRMWTGITRTFGSTSFSMSLRQPSIWTRPVIPSSCEDIVSSRLTHHCAKTWQRACYDSLDGPPMTCYSTPCVAAEQSLSKQHLWHAGSRQDS